MAERKVMTKGPRKPTRKAGAPVTDRFTDEERQAMKERARELKSGSRRRARAAAGDGESDVLARIAEMPEPDRTMAGRFHALVKANAPGLKPRTWYGMPAYANEDDKPVCFFQSRHKFKTRYSTMAFTDKATLDDGSMWPTGFALEQMTADDELRIAALLCKAVGKDASLKST